MEKPISGEEYEKLLRQLVQIKSLYFHEDQVMEFVNRWFAERGVPAQIHTFYEPKETKFHEMCIRDRQGAEGSSPGKRRMLFL